MVLPGSKGLTRTAHASGTRVGGGQVLPCGEPRRGIRYLWRRATGLPVPPTESTINFDFFLRVCIKIAQTLRVRAHSRSFKRDRTRLGALAVSGSSHRLLIR